MSLRDRLLKPTTQAKNQGYILARGVGHQPQMIGDIEVGLKGPVCSEHAWHWTLGSTLCVCNSEIERGAAHSHVALTVPDVGRILRNVQPNHGEPQ